MIFAEGATVGCELAEEGGLVVCFKSDDNEVELYFEELAHVHAFLAALSEMAVLTSYGIRTGNA